HFVIGLAGAFLDGALDGVTINRGFAGLFERGLKAWIRVGIGSAELGSNRYFANELVDQLTFFLRVGFASGLFPLCAHDSSLRVFRFRFNAKSYAKAVSGAS